MRMIYGLVSAVVRNEKPLLRVVYAWSLKPLYHAVKCSESGLI